MNAQDFDNSPGIREFRNHLSAYVRQVERTREPVIVHVQGRPVAALAPVTPTGMIDTTSTRGRANGCGCMVHEDHNPTTSCPECGIEICAMCLAAFGICERCIADGHSVEGRGW